MLINLVFCVKKNCHTMYYRLVFSPVWTLICLLSLFLLANDWPHNVQLYGFSPVWTLMCRLRLLLLVNNLPHNVQLYGLSPVWTLVCRARSLFRTKNLPHWEQLNLFLSSSSTTSVWLYEWWEARVPLCVNDLPHNVQLNGFSPVWTLVWLASLLFLSKVFWHCWQLKNLVVLTPDAFSELLVVMPTFSAWVFLWWHASLSLLANNLPQNVQS
jgi:hypothetical protein